MIYAITGSHSTGKTTLAQAFAEQNGFEFITIDSSALKIAGDIRPGRRLDEFEANEQARIQIEYCEQLIDLYEMMKDQRSRTFVTDCHPITPFVYASHLIKNEVHSRYKERLRELIIQTASIGGTLITELDNNRGYYELLGRKYGVASSRMEGLFLFFNFPTIPLEDNGFRPLSTSLRYNISKMIRECVTPHTYLWERSLQDRLKKLSDGLILRKTDIIMADHERERAYFNTIVPKSTFFALEGPPGSGKTTAINMLRNLHSVHTEIRVVKRKEVNPSRKEEWKEIWKKRDPYEILESYSKSMMKYQREGHEPGEQTEPIIIFDRCIDTALSTAVGCGMTLDEAIDRVPHEALKERPYVIQLRIPEKSRLNRCLQRGEDHTGSPKLDSELQEKIAFAYEDISRIFPTARLNVTNMEERDQLYKIIDLISVLSGITVSQRFAMLHAMWNNMEPKTNIPDTLDNWVLESQIQLGSISRLAIQSIRGIETNEVEFEKEIRKQVTDLIYSAINMLYRRGSFPDLNLMVNNKLVQDYLKLRNRIPIGKI